MSTTAVQPKENKMGTMPINKLLLNMSLPMMIAMLIQALYNIIDSMFVAQISENALSAVSLAFPMQNFMIAVGTGTGVGVNALLSKRFSVQDIDYGLISRLGVMTNAGFQRSIFLYQFNYRVIAATGNDMVKQIRLNLLFLLSQRKLSLFTPGSRVILIQTPTVHILLFTILVNISVTIPPICTLVFTFTQNPISIVSSFFTHRNLSFQNKESQTCSFILSQIRLSV